MREVVNSFLNDYGIYIIAIIFILTAISAVIANMSLLTDHAPGVRQKGFMNILYIFLYVAMGVAVIGFIVTMVTRMKIQI